MSNYVLNLQIGSDAMQLTKLVIFGFGKHEDKTIELEAGVNVLYGYNEAGKTTIQQFILHILFGFPSRGSQLLRYEPKSGSKYGGQVHLQDEEYGDCIVERVRGKSSGDVTVYTEDGRQGDEAFLAKLLRHYDRATFESIFSFSLLQLQGFDKMDEKQLSRTLLASATTGFDDLLRIEDQVNKEKGALYKRKGKNPLVNRQLEKVQLAEESLQKARQKTAQYEPTIAKLQALEERFGELRAEQKEVNKQLEQLKIQQQLQPLQFKRKQLGDQLATKQQKGFPIDGIQRYEALRYQYDEVDASITALEKNLQELPQIDEASNLDEQHQRLEQQLAKEAEWHRLNSSIAAMHGEIRELQQQISKLKARLGIHSESSEEVLYEADVSLQKEQEMYTLMEQYQQCEREFDDTEASKMQLENDLVLTRKKKDLLQEPTMEEREIARSWPTFQQQYRDAVAEKNAHETQKNQLKIVAIIIALMISVYTITALLNQQYTLLFITVIGVGILGGWLYRKSSGQSFKEQQSIMKKYKQQAGQYEKIAEEVRVYDEESAQVRRDLAKYEEQFNVLEVHKKALEHELLGIKQQLQQFLQQYNIPEVPSVQLVPELFRMIRALQEHLRQYAQYQQSYFVAQEKLAKWLDSLAVLLEKPVTSENAYELIRARYYEVRQLQEQQVVVKRQQQQLEQSIQEKKALRHTLATQQRALWNEAQVSTEEGYYQAYEEQKEKAALQDALLHITEQLAAYEDVEMNWTLSQTDVQVTMNQLRDQLQEIQEEQETLRANKAQYLHTIQALQTDEQLGELAQKSAVEQANLNELTQQWAVKQVMATAIEQFMRTLKEQRFPEVLATSAEIFSKLTGGRYKQLQITDQGLFEAVMASGETMPIIELSQATKEQAYLALRFALAIAVHEHAPFPIIVDDPFVHFDERRLSHIIKVVEQLTTHQFIYFTCHKEMTTCWTNAKVYHLESEKGASIS